VTTSAPPTLSPLPDDGADTDRAADPAGR
jgi:hypothetical protein